jgi:hypothetical protein
VGEDRGDTLHDQLGALDSIWSFDLTQPKPAIVADAKRLVALGRDPEASGTSGPTSEDNETTGVLVSDGDSSIGGLPGREDPGKTPRTRAFFTQQHGQNHTYELLLRRHGRH